MMSAPGDSGGMFARTRDSPATSLHPASGAQLPIYLAEGVHGVVIGDDLALIDLDADAYLCLPGGGVDVTQVQGVLEIHGEGARAIIQAGLASDRPAHPARSAPPLPLRSLIHEPAPQVSPAMALRSLAAARDVHRALRGEGLRPILSVAPTTDHPVDPPAVEDAARALWALSPWLPLEGECLVRSALLMSYLRRCGLSASWVFGVRLWPFSAHCWVQLDAVCLNDDVERLAAYAPIYCR